MKIPMVYILTNRKNGVLYTGVTSNPARRMYEHRNGLIKGFTEKYGCKTLVYFELHPTITQAIAREKQIKNVSRNKKIALIQHMSPNWDDLYIKLMRSIGL